MSDTLLLKVQNLSVTRDDKQILEDITFSIYPKKIITIIGPNGSGKSTLAKAILGLIKPTKGEVFLKAGLTFGYMPQKIELNPYLPLTVLDFLNLAVRHKHNKETLNDIVNKIAISHILSTSLQKISGGELQKVLLARALLKNPDILILDEPTQGIDINGQIEFYDLIDNLRFEKNIACLIISHDLHMVMKKTEHVICLNHHICCEGHPSFINKQQKFQDLFSNRALEVFSIYEHNHDHSHD